VSFIHLRGKLSEIKGKTIISVKTIEGVWKDVKVKNIVGYCHYKHHKGVLTKNLFKFHRCDRRGCYYFQKFAEYPFWENMEKQKAIEKTFAEKEKEKKLSKVYISNDILSDISIMISEHPLPTIVTSITRINPIMIQINYVTNRDYDDHVDFNGIKKKLQTKYNQQFKLQHIKLLNGEYAKISDYLSRRK
jgi:hypothetical protein